VLREQGEWNVPAIVLGVRVDRAGACTSRPKPPTPAPPASAASTTTRCTTCSGLKDNSWQSLYHFSMGVPVEDTRLTMQPVVRLGMNHEGHEDHEITVLKQMLRGPSCSSWFKEEPVVTPKSASDLLRASGSIFQD
jgi:hypothetical protein